MAGTLRADEPGFAYHVLNRGNGRMRLFHKDGDFAAFEQVLVEGLARYPVELYTYCLMDNHWHLVLAPLEAGAMGRLMGWVGVTHVRRHHEHYHTRGGGHLYQGRFKSFPIQQDRHFLRVCRYVEANALRAGAVRRAEDWPWCGLAARTRGGKPIKLSPWPIDRPAGWREIVNDVTAPEELTILRAKVNRGQPYGAAAWIEQTARHLGLEATVRDIGRPRKRINQ